MRMKGFRSVSTRCLRPQRGNLKPLGPSSSHQTWSLCRRVGGSEAYMFCYPKQKTARERRSGAETHDMPSTRSHPSLRPTLIIQRKQEKTGGRESKRSPAWICSSYCSLCVQASDLCPPPLLLSSSSYLFHLVAEESEEVPFSSTVHITNIFSSLAGRAAAHVPRSCGG